MPGAALPGDPGRVTVDRTELDAQAILIGLAAVNFKKRVT